MRKRICSETCSMQFALQCNYNCSFIALVLPQLITTSSQKFQNFPRTKLEWASDGRKRAERRIMLWNFFNWPNGATEIFTDWKFFLRQYFLVKEFLPEKFLFFFNSSRNKKIEIQLAAKSLHTSFVWLKARCWYENSYGKQNQRLQIL